jgi:MFS family permease
MTVVMKAELGRTTKAFTHALLGGLVFWTPNVVVHWIIAYRFSGFVVIGLTVLLPATTILFFRKISWPSPKQLSRLSPSLFAVLGIWIAGPSMMTFSSSFCGGGLSQPDAWRFFVFGTLLFPLFTLVMSAYDGTFFALLLTTLLLPILANPRLKEAVRQSQ